MYVPSYVMILFVCYIIFLFSFVRGKVRFTIKENIFLISFGLLIFIYFISLFIPHKTNANICVKDSCMNGIEVYFNVHDDTIEVYELKYKELLLLKLKETTYAKNKQ